ncbi:MAG: AI-2E family transporter [Gammaproteobacteria bacterium]|nr:MAG: AI-2E family transporter [Gammaproteobacteria bacterium]
MLQALLNNNISRSILLFTLIILIIAFLAYLLAPLLLPIIISFALYALLEPLTSMIERRGLSRTTSSLAVLLFMVALAAICISLFMPHFSAQISQLQQQLPLVWKTVVGMAENASNFIAHSIGIDLRTTKLTDRFFDQANDWGKIALIEGSNIIISFTVLLLLVPLFTFFLIRDYRNFRNYLLDKLPNRSFELGWLIYHRVAHQLQEYIRGIMIQSGIMTIVTSLGFYLIHLESPILLGIIAGILNLIPYVGPLLAMVLPVLLALGHAPLELWLIGAAIGVILVAQIIDNVIVIPAVIANAVDLHPIIVIIGIIIFGNLFGFIGMVLAIPVISTANIIFRGLLQGIKSRQGPILASE